MSYHQLTEHERYQIYALKKAGHGQKEIATPLGRSSGMLSRWSPSLPRGSELYQHLRILCKPYRKRYGHCDRRGRIRHRVDRDDRPAVVDERSRIDDWEGDTVMGKGCKSALLTLVERKTRYTRIVRLRGKRAERLAQAAPGCMRDIADQVKTVTFDNGLEFVECGTSPSYSDLD